MIADELIENEAYLVERGVRPLALLETCEADETMRLKILTRLKSVCYKMDVIPFVIDRGDGATEYGIASSGWALNLYKWLLTTQIPQVQKDRICGLLFGYSIQSISRFDDTSNARILETNP